MTGRRSGAGDGPARTGAASGPAGASCGFVCCTTLAGAFGETLAAGDVTAGLASGLEGADFATAGFPAGGAFVAGLATAFGGAGFAGFVGAAAVFLAAAVCAALAGAGAAVRRGGPALRKACAPRPFTAVPADTFMLDTFYPCPLRHCDPFGGQAGVALTRPGSERSAPGNGSSCRISLAAAVSSNIASRRRYVIG
jgi:hypothetical protein